MEARQNIIEERTKQANMCQGTENFGRMLYDKMKAKQDRRAEKKDFNKNYKEDLVAKWNASNAHQYNLRVQYGRKT